MKETFSVKKAQDTAPFWYSVQANSLRLSLHIQPGAKKTEVCGLYGHALKIRLAAPPVDGKANAALIEFLAKQCQVPKRAVHVIHGQLSREKVVEIQNLSTLPEAFLLSIPTPQPALF